MTVMKNGNSWKALGEHYNEVAPLQMRDMFADDSRRFEKFSLRFNDILLDFSKNRVTEKTMQLLHGLVEEAELSVWIEKMFAGEAINHTEQRAVLHVALRNMSGQPMFVDGRMSCHRSRLNWRKWKR